MSEARPFMVRTIARSALLLLVLLVVAPARASLVIGSDTLDGQAYTTYTEAGETAFRIVCQTPCPIPLATLQAASDGFRLARAQVLGLSGLAPVAELQPVDIAYEANGICPLLPWAVGYSGTYFPYGIGNGLPRHAKMCLFLWNYQQDGSVDYFTPALAGLASSKMLAVHEYGHTLFFDRHQYSYEDFAFYWSFVVSGTYPLPQGMCSEAVNLHGAPLVHGLCQRYGADDSDVRDALEQIDQLDQAGLGYHGERTSVAQFRAALDARLGVDTSDLFLDRYFAPQEVGLDIPGQRSAGWTWFEAGLPGNVFHLSGRSEQADVNLKLEQPTCLQPLPFLDFSLAFQIVRAEHREYTHPLPVVSMDDFEVTYSWAHWQPQPGVDPRNFRVYQLDWSCGETSPATEWYALPAAQVQFDYAQQRVTFHPASTGTFILAQPDVIFAAGFEH